MGDFNTARFSDENVGGNPLSIKKLTDFNGCIQHCSLSDIESLGSAWT